MVIRWRNADPFQDSDLFLNLVHTGNKGVARIHQSWDRDPGGGFQVWYFLKEFEQTGVLAVY